MSKSAAMFVATRLGLIMNSNKRFTPRQKGRAAAQILIKVKELEAKAGKSNGL